MKRGVRFTALIWLMMVIAREVPAAVPGKECNSDLLCF